MSSDTYRFPAEPGNGRSGRQGRSDLVTPLRGVCDPFQWAIGRHRRAKFISRPIGGRHGRMSVRRGRARWKKRGSIPGTGSVRPIVAAWVVEVLEVAVVLLGGHVRVATSGGEDLVVCVLRLPSGNRLAAPLERLQDLVCHHHEPGRSGRCLGRSAKACGRARAPSYA